MYSFSPQQLQQMHHGQPELGMQNIEVPRAKPMSWPVSQPKQQQKRIHVSINGEYGNLTHSSLQAHTTFCEYPYQQRNSLFDVPLHMRNVGHQRVIQPSALDDDILYSCKVIAQLQGNYEVESAAGRVQVSVILPKVAEHEEQYAKVQLISSDGRPLADKFIYNDFSCFKLCSENKLEGVLAKGSKMKHSVEWWNKDDESWIVWRRKGKVTFNLFQVEPSSRRSSISSICTVSTSPVVARSIDTSTLGTDENPMFIRPELLQPRRPVFMSRSPSVRFSPTFSFQPNTNSMFVGSSSVNSDQHYEELFERIKAQCLKNAGLLQKVVDWGIANNPERNISEDEAKNLSDGRFWIIAHSEDIGEGEVAIDSLDDIKGAYQESSAGVYMQPDPKVCGSDAQHRLFKDQHGCWLLERQETGCETWQVRAQQQEHERWIDFKNNKIPIRVHVVPMSSILENLGEEDLASKSELKTSIEFLFTDCNQEKLTKLKGRNLKHHIANLKVKLQKRYALSFGLRVTNIAEIISQE